MMKMIKPATSNCFAIAVLLVAVHMCSAQKAIINGPFRITFPTTNWSEAEPPPEMRKIFESGESPAKLVLYATCPKSQLTFCITRFDYRSTNDLHIAIAGYLEGIHKGCVRQAVGKIAEEPGRIPMSGVPTYSFTAKGAGDLYLQKTALLCADRLYMLDFNGPESSRAEAAQWLEGVSFWDEPGLLNSTFKSALQVRTNLARRKTLYEEGRRSAYVIIPLVIGFIIVNAVRGKRGPSNPRQASGKVPALPPPLPSTKKPPPLPQ